MSIVRALKEFRNVVDILPSPVTEIFYYFTVISSKLHLVSRGQTAFSVFLWGGGKRVWTSSQAALVLTLAFARVVLITETRCIPI